MPRVAEALLKRTRGSGAEVIKLKGGAGFAVGISIREVVHAIALGHEADPAGLVAGQRPVRHPRRLHLGADGGRAQRRRVASSRSSSGPRKPRRSQHSAQVLRETIDAVYKSNPKAAGQARRHRAAGGRLPSSTSNRSPAPGDDGVGGGQRSDLGSSRVTISGQGRGKR